MSEPFEYIRYFFSIPDNKTIHEHLPNGIGFESIIDLMRGYASKKDRQLARKDKRIKELEDRERSRKEIKRYHVRGTEFKYGKYSYFYNEEENGEWVKYEDIKPSLEDKEPK